MENKETKITDVFQDWLKVHGKVIIQENEMQRYTNPGQINRSTYKVMFRADALYHLQHNNCVYEQDPFQLYNATGHQEDQFFHMVAGLQAGRSLCHDTGWDGLGNYIDSWYLKEW